MKCKYVICMLSFLVSNISYTLQLIEHKEEPYVPVFVNCRTIFDVGYSEWCYMVSREQSAHNKYCETTINPTTIQESSKALEEYQSELEELIRYRRTLLQKLLTTIQSVADWYGANSIVLFYNREYMWVNSRHDITQEVIDELNDYHEYINQLISIQEPTENKNNFNNYESKDGN